MKKIILFVVVSVSAFASSFVEVESKYNTEITVKKISALIEGKKGFSIFTVIDHQKNAYNAGMKLPFQKVIVFGNPHAGTKLMQSDTLVGYELPMKIMVYKKDEKVIVVYRKPEYFAENYALKDSPILPKMKKAMNYFISSIKK